MAKQNNQLRSFSRYLSLGPVLAIVAISVAFTVWTLINDYVPDLLFYPAS